MVIDYKSQFTLWTYTYDCITCKLGGVSGHCGRGLAIMVDDTGLSLVVFITSAFCKATWWSKVVRFLFKVDVKIFNTFTEIFWSWTLLEMEWFNSMEDSTFEKKFW